VIQLSPRQCRFRRQWARSRKRHHINAGLHDLVHLAGKLSFFCWSASSSSAITVSWRDYLSPSQSTATGGRIQRTQAPD
jgi:hypothetical protein